MRRGLAIAACVALIGCTQGARDLPPDYGSVSGTGGPPAERFSAEDLALSCDDVAAERTRLADAIEQAEAVIKGDRRRNQTAGYFAALFLLPIVAVDTNDEQVEVIDRSRARVDTLRALSRFKNCAEAPPT